MLEIVASVHNKGEYKSMSKHGFIEGSIPKDSMPVKQRELFIKLRQLIIEYHNMNNDCHSGNSLDKYYTVIETLDQLEEESKYV